MSEKLILFLTDLYAKEKVSEKEFYLTKRLYYEYARPFHIFNRKFKKSEEYNVFLDILLIEDIMKNKSEQFTFEKISSLTLKKFIEQKGIKTQLTSYGINGLELFKNENIHIYNAVHTIELLLDDNKKRGIRAIWQFSSSFIGALFGALIAILVALISK